MRDKLGVVFLVLGYLTIIVGSIGLFAYGLYDIVHNFDTMSRTDLFWDLLMMIFKEVIPALIGLFFIFIGFLLKSK